MKNIYSINNNIYITNSAKIKEGEWCFELYNGDSKAKAPKFEDSNGDTWWLRKINMNCSPTSIGVKKIILTTDQKLIKDGIQSIAPEFTEWFAQNKECEQVEINNEVIKATLEKAAEEYADKQSSKAMRASTLDFAKSGEELWLEAKTDFTEGAKWKSEQIYSQIDLTNLCYYDRRNPDFQFDADEEETADTGEFAKEDCYCDNCFYGRAKMTEYFISLTKKI